MIIDNRHVIIDKSCDYRNFCTYVNISDFQHLAVHLYAWFYSLFNDGRQHIEGLGQDEGRRRRMETRKKMGTRTLTYKWWNCLLPSTYSFVTPIL